ncbi:hypothetical protein D9M73_285820 [compost metagenome]
MADKKADPVGLRAGIAYEQVRADLKGVAIGEPQLLRAGAAWFERHGKVLVQVVDDRSLLQ